MAPVNPHFQKLKTAYIFPIIEQKLDQLQAQHPNQKVINLGIGDISLPLAPAIARAIHAAVDEMTQEPRGYGPSSGYLFLKEAICKHEYAEYGISPDEIFISDGANTDASSIQELFDESAIIAITDPTYPVYRDANLIAGKKLLIIPLKEEEGFIPIPPKERADLVYLCTPCNPTGVALNKEQLQVWVDWARKNKALLIIDNVYNIFISSEDIPASIYALEGAREVAIEIRSFSKAAGFTGLRCSYMVVPKALQPPHLHELWVKRTNIKTNGISYPIQRGAEACYTDQGRSELKAQIEIYQSSAKRLHSALEMHGETFFGGVHSPYIWWKAPQGMTSWEFFDELLQSLALISIPGSGFGPCGEGFVRLSCFLSNELAKEASHALHNYFVSA